MNMGIKLIGEPTATNLTGSHILAAGSYYLKKYLLSIHGRVHSSPMLRKEANIKKINRRIKWNQENKSSWPRLLSVPISRFVFTWPIRSLIIVDRVLRRISLYKSYCSPSIFQATIWRFAPEWFRRIIVFSHFWGLLLVGSAGFLITA